MNSQWKRIVAVTGIFGLTAAGPSAFAVEDVLQGRGFGMRQQSRMMKRQGGSMDGMIHQLGLTEEQREALQERRRTQMNNSQALRTKLRQKRLELKNALDNLETDEATINALVEEITALSSDQLKARVQGVLAIKEILTPEQFNELKTRMGKQKGKFRHREGRGFYDGGAQGKGKRYRN